MQYGHHTVLEYCGIDHVGVSAERASYGVNAVRFLTNLRDAAHGRMLMTLLDVTLGQAVLAAVTDAKSFATVQVDTDLIGPGRRRSSPACLFVGPAPVVSRLSRQLCNEQQRTRQKLGALSNHALIACLRM